MEVNMAKHHAVSDTSFMRCILEEEVKRSPEFWHKIESTEKEAGSKDGNNRKVATVTYQLYIFGRPTDIVIKFFYDHRKNFAEFDVCPVGQKVLQHSIQGDMNEEIIAEVLGLKQKV